MIRPKLRKCNNIVFAKTEQEPSQTNSTINNYVVFYRTYSEHGIRMAGRRFSIWSYYYTIISNTIYIELLVLTNTFNEILVILYFMKNEHPAIIQFLGFHHQSIKNGGLYSMMKV
jgi:hypothetical protein